MEGSENGQINHDGEIICLVLKNTKEVAYQFLQATSSCFIRIDKAGYLTFLTFPDPAIDWSIIGFPL